MRPVSGQETRLRGSLRPHEIGSSRGLGCAVPMEGEPLALQEARPGAVRRVMQVLTKTDRQATKVSDWPGRTRAPAARLNENYTRHSRRRDSARDVRFSETRVVSPSSVVRDGRQTRAGVPVSTPLNAGEAEAACSGYDMRE